MGLESKDIPPLMAGLRGQKKQGLKLQWRVRGENARAPMAGAGDWNTQASIPGLESERISVRYSVDWCAMRHYGKLLDRSYFFIPFRVI